MPKPLKVCHLLLGAANEVAGIQKYLTSLLQANDFAVINKASLYAKHLTDNHHNFYIYRNIFDFLKIIKREQPQIMHVHLGQGILPAWLCSLKYPQLKLVYTQHFISPAHTENCLFFIKNILLKLFFINFSAMIAISSAVAAGITKRKEISKNKIKLIYNGINLPPKPQAKKKVRPKIISICRLEKEKQPEKIIDLALASPDFDFILAGSGSLLNKLKKNAPANLKILGWVSNISSLLKNNFFFFFPAKAEPFGLAVAEALSYGLPVIAYKSGAMPELVSAQEGLLLEKNDNLNKAANYIGDLVNNPVLYRKISAACYKKAQLFSLTAMQEKTFALYRSLING